MLGVFSQFQDLCLLSANGKILVYTLKPAQA